MLYDSKMLKSFPQSFAFAHFPPALPLAASRAHHAPDRERVPSSTAAFAS
jgi:hypothetical protein